MRFIDLFWFFLDGDKSSSQIIKEKNQQKTVNTENTEQVEIDDVEFFDDCDFEDF